MKDFTLKEDLSPVLDGSRNILDELLRSGARKMLQSAIEQEVSDFIENNKTYKDTEGKSLVFRNGYAPERDILSGIGPIKIKRPRVDDRKLRKDKNKSGFSSEILPRFLRRVPSIDNLLPILYLKGISTGDFPTALQAILGANAKNISANTIVRLKESWEKEYYQWSKRDLSDKKYVYFWVDGIHLNVRLEKERPCILVIMAADQDGNKELLAVSDGVSESKIGWKDILLDLRNRGLSEGPKLTVGDGALGFWSALNEVFPNALQQRCWVHKTANILDKLPKRLRSQAKGNIHNMYMASDKETAYKEFDKFIELYQDKYPKATECLEKNKDKLFAFYDFPAIHWTHIRTTNPIESTFATIRLRTYRTRGCGNRKTVFSMVFKLALEAQKRWKKLKGHNLIYSILRGDKYIDGVIEKVA